MAAYAALTSLKYIVDQLRDHPSPPISLDKQQVESLTEKVAFLQEFLESYRSPVANSIESADPLEMRIADAAYAAEDVIESHIVDMIQLRRSTTATTTTQQKLDSGAETSTSAGSNKQKKPTVSFNNFRFLMKPINYGKKINSKFGLYQGMREMIKGMKLIKEDMNVMKITKEKATIIEADEEFLESYHSPVANIIEAAYPLEMRIADAAEDMIKLRGSTTTTTTTQPKLDSGEETGTPAGSKYGLHQGMQRVIKELDLIKEDVMKIKKENATIIEADKMQRNVLTRSRSSTMVVGFDDVLLEILDKLTGGHKNRQVISIVGMGGIGKTTLAKTVFDHAFVKDHFDTCAWVTISQKYNTKEILCELLSQANRKGKEELSYMGEDELELDLHKYLSYRRYLIVLDDMWSVEVWEKIQRSFPDYNNSSRIVVTTRLSNLGTQLGSYSLKMKFLDEGSSWDLFSKSVFGEGSCPLELEEIGKEMVENCRGLPLAIAVVGGLLKRTEHTKRRWESIRQNSSSLVNSENEDFCLKILKMSYNHLPVHLKPCFLYMGVFEEDRMVRASTLVKLWVSEGFLKPIRGKSLETAAKEYLNDLVDRNLILVHELGSLGSIKYCKLHDLLRDLCWREAGKEGFYNVIGQHKFGSLNRQCRVVIPGRTSLDEVHDSALQPMPLARSFLCDSTQVLPFPESKLLRTLKAYDRDTSRSHDFSFDDLFWFVNLRYLAAGVHGLSEFPSSISLWNLQMLIILHCSWVYAPVEIWEMRQLSHVEVHKGGLELPNPPNGNGVVMKNLQTLKGVCYLDCEVVCKMIPNIKKLRALEPTNPFNLEGLSKLESCSCCGGNISKGKNSTFPYSLKKLSLGSYSSPWEVNQGFLDRLGALPRLQKLKLEQAHFQSKEWETREDQFPILKVLQLKCCILESWRTESSHFPRLEKLHLYELKELDEIPSDIGDIPTLQSILLEYCSESAVKSAKIIAEEQEELQVRVVLLNNDKSQALRSLSSPNFLVEIVNF